MTISLSGPNVKNQFLICRLNLVLILCYSHQNNYIVGACEEKTMAWLTLPVVSRDLHVDIKIEPATNWWKIINFKTTAYYMFIYLST